MRFALYARLCIVINALLNCITSWQAVLFDFDYQSTIEAPNATGSLFRRLLRQTVADSEKHIDQSEPNTFRPVQQNVSTSYSLSWNERACSSWSARWCGQWEKHFSEIFPRESAFLGARLSELTTRSKCFTRFFECWGRVNLILSDWFSCWFLGKQVVIFFR